MDTELQQKLIDYLSGFATPNRLNRFEQVLSQRTRYFVLALENFFQPHNASAVLRTMECFGIQDAHIIENGYEYRVNHEISLGSSQWLTLVRYGESSSDKRGFNSEAAIKNLRSLGYRIVATTPHPSAVGIDEFDLKKGASAFFFGTELEGLSDTVMEEADEFLRIPICGFTESFNVSVSAALVIHQLSERLRRSRDIRWQLTEAEKQDLRLEWLKQSVRHSDLIIKRFLEDEK
jgi:tRNA (guanosine-2'-O-)-methyltransferase